MANTVTVIACRPAGIREQQGARSRAWTQRRGRRIVAMDAVMGHERLAVMARSRRAGRIKISRWIIRACECLLFPRRGDDGLDVGPAVDRQLPTGLFSGLSQPGVGRATLAGDPDASSMPRWIDVRWDRKASIQSRGAYRPPPERSGGLRVSDHRRLSIRPCIDVDSWGPQADRAAWAQDHVSR